MHAQVQIHWADLGQFETAMRDDLSPQEAERAYALVHEADRRRFVLGASLLRRAVAGHLGSTARDVPVDRTCPRCGAQHGKPQLPGSGLHASLSHTGEVVALALSTAAPIGLDVEGRTQRDWPALLDVVLAPHETPPRSEGEFLAYWTRKESVLKATGDGLNLDLSAVVISAPAQPPRVISYDGGTLRASMFDLAPRDGYVGALTVLTTAPIEIVRVENVLV